MQQYVERQRNFDIWDRLWYDKKGNVVIWQRPNLLLIGWAVIDIASLVTKGHTSNVLWWVGTVVLGVWALLEIGIGANYFRRVLGLVVLLMVVASVFKFGL